MAFESSIGDVRRMMNRMQNLSGDNSSGVLLFEDAYNRVLEAIKPQMQDMLDEKMAGKDEIITMTKADLRAKKEQYRKLIEMKVLSETYSVEGYEDKDDFIEAMVEEIVGYSVLVDAFNDPDVDDIFCLAWDKIYVERRGRNEKYHRNFRNPKHYKEFIERILGETGKTMNQGDHKIVDAEFYEDRIAVTHKATSPKDYSMTIRKHKEHHILLSQIIAGGTMSQEIADVLGTIIKGERNLIYAGITGSGKTTTLRALLDHYVTETNKRMVVVEDTQELFPANDHTLELITTPTKNPDTNVSLRDLIMTALRLKPKYIVVGEVRGVEAEAAVEAMETGHSTLFSMHGGTPFNIVNRLVNKYLMQMPSLSIDVVERIIGSSVDYIAIQDDIPGIGRRVSSLSELMYDFDEKRVKVIPIYEFDFESNTFVQVNKLSPEKATLMMRRGIPIEEVRNLIREEEGVYYRSLKEFKEKSKGPRVSERKAKKKEILDMLNEVMDEDDVDAF